MMKSCWFCSASTPVPRIIDEGLILLLPKLWEIIELDFTLYGVAPKLIDYWTFFYSSVMSKSISILSSFSLSSAYFCRDSLMIGLLEFEIFSSLLAILYWFFLPAWGGFFFFRDVLSGLDFWSGLLFRFLSPRMSSMLQLPLGGSKCSILFL